MSFQSSSSFRRSGQRDDRRRRLLTDELANSGDWPACRVQTDEGALALQSEHYGQAEFLEQQLQLLDLVPRRIVGPLLVLAVGAAIIAGLEFSYTWMLDRVAKGGAAVAALDLGAKGSLGCWFSSLLLLAAAAGAILVYRVRRYRTDDYQGRYRIWLWAAACLGLVATDQAASLREAFRDWMVALTGTLLAGDGSPWWVIFYTLVLGAVGSRLMLDMRECPLSLSALLIAALTHIAVTASQLGWIPSQGGRWDVAMRVGAEMGGNLLLLTAMMLHARHVLLDAEGMLPCRKAEPDDDLADDEEADEAKYHASLGGNRWTKIDPPHATPQPVFQRPATPVPAATPTSASGLSPVNRKLTKGERKALKERLLRERRERERS